MTRDEAVNYLTINKPSGNAYQGLQEAIDMAIAALRAPVASGEATEAHGYLSRLLTHCAPYCQPLPDLMGLCSQIDNLIAGLRAAPPATAGGDAPEIRVDDVVVRYSKFGEPFTALVLGDRVTYHNRTIEEIVEVRGERAGQPFIWRRRQEGQ